MEYQQQTFRGFCHRTWLQEYTELKKYLLIIRKCCVSHYMPYNMQSYKLRTSLTLLNYGIYLAYSARHAHGK